MSENYDENRFRRSVLLPSGIWLLLCAAYISISVGWGNLFAFLPLEIAVLLLSMVLPIFLFATWHVLSKADAQAADVADELDRQGERIEEMYQALSTISETQQSGSLSASDMAALLAMPNDLRNMKTGQTDGLETLNETLKQSRLVGGEDMQTVQALPERIAGLIEGQSRSIQGLTGKMDDLVRHQESGEGQIDFGEIRQQTALVGLITFVLNDINVSTTRLLVKLMEKEERSREEIRDFIMGLSNAYAMGDRGVFVSVMQHQLANNQERVVLLQSLAEGSSDVAADLSKIMRESKEVFSLIGQFGEENIVTALFDERTLRALNSILESHFSQEGSAIKFTVS